MLDISDENIVTKDDFLISIEWLKDVGDSKLIQFPFLFKGEHAYHKANALASWGQIPVGYGLYCIVSKQLD